MMRFFWKEIIIMKNKNMKSARIRAAILAAILAAIMTLTACIEPAVNPAPSSAPDNATSANAGPDANVSAEESANVSAPDPANESADNDASESADNSAEKSAVDESREASEDGDAQTSAEQSTDTSDEISEPVNVSETDESEPVSDDVSDTSEDDPISQDTSKNETSKPVEESEPPKTETSKSDTSETSKEHTHSFKKQSVVAPTCTEEGYTLYACSCGETKKDKVKAALGHCDKDMWPIVSYSKYDDVVLPDIGKKGYEALICGRCGAEIRRETSWFIADEKDMMAVLDIINQLRAEKGVAPATWDHAAYMAAKDYIHDVVLAGELPEHLKIREYGLCGGGYESIVSAYVNNFAGVNKQFAAEGLTGHNPYLLMPEVASIGIATAGILDGTGGIETAEGWTIAVGAQAGSADVGIDRGFANPDYYGYDRIASVRRRNWAIGTRIAISHRNIDLWACGHKITDLYLHDNPDDDERGTITVIHDNGDVTVLLDSGATDRLRYGKEFFYKDY